MLFEAVEIAVTNNNRGDRPSMNFVEGILRKLEATQRADEIRRKEIEYRANPQMKPETKSAAFADKGTYMAQLYEQFIAEHTDRKEDESNG